MTRAQRSLTLAALPSPSARLRGCHFPGAPVTAPPPGPTVRAPRLLNTVLAVLLTASLTADANARRRRPEVTPPPDYEEVMALGTTDRMAAIAQLEKALTTRTTTDESRPWMLLAAGEQRRLAGDRAMSRSWFGLLTRDHPDHPLVPAAKLGMALVDADESLSGNVVATLQLLEGPSIPDSMQADRYRLLALDGIDQGSPPGRIKEYVRKAVVHATADPSVEARVKITLADQLTAVQDAELEADPATLPSLEEDAIRRAREALRAGRLEEASRLASQFVETWPESESVTEAEYIQKRADSGDRVVAGKVGVLLPSSGKYATIGKRIRQVVELANERSGSRMQLVFRDAHGSAEETALAVEELVIDEGCVAVLGPLLKEDVMAAAEAAQALGVPMVALSQSQDPASVGSFIYRGFMPVEQQVDALVAHAMGDQGIQNFGVMFPDTGFGKRATEAFEAAVEKRGGKVTRVVGYNPKATDFRAEAKRLGAKDYSARSAEYARLKRDAEEKGMDPSKVVLPPSIDFDAIFIPDAWQRVGLVASALAYEEFAVGDFLPHRHAKSIQLLGLNAWNDDRIIENGGDYVQNAVFVDAFDDGSRRAGVAEFVGDHRAALGRKPGVIDALAWDAARLLSTAVVAGGPDRVAVRDELAQARLSTPVAGGGRFGEDREVDRSLMVLTIDGDRIREWTPPALNPSP